MAAETNALASIALGAALAAGASGAILAAFSTLVARRLSSLSVVVGCVLIGIAGLSVIVGPATSFHGGAVLGFHLIDVRFDALSGTFLVALGIVGAAASVYALGSDDAGRSRLDSLAYVGFVASLALVLGSASAFAFLFAWEAMAVLSTILILGPRPNRTVVRASYVYVAMTHLATGALAVAFAIWSTAAASLDFGAFRDAAGTLGSVQRDAIFVLLLIGFGTKAGMMPLHVWLPRTHPIAPSHVSALMSGIMIKVGIYGLIRFGIGYLGVGPAWWGMLVLALGAASAIFGVLYALSEHDLKRLLAFSSVENIGIVLIGIGVALIGATARSPALVVAGTAAALFHAVNHALFKALLFLGAGAVHESTHSRDLNRLGGLARIMPLTAVAFGIGAAAISGLPPLNGFASEWLTFHALLDTGGSTAVPSIARFASYLGVGALGLTAALAVAAFVKVTGMTFLAKPRSAAAAGATDVARPMRGALVLLAASCVLVGVAAGPIGGVIADVVRSTTTVDAFALDPVALPDPGVAGSYDPALILAALAAGTVALIAVAGFRTDRVRRAMTWTCGIVAEPGFQYTATSFSKPLRLFFEPVLRPTRDLRMEPHDGAPQVGRFVYRSETDHLIETRIYRPLHRAAIAFAQIARRAQQGTLQLYVAYTVVTIVVLLVLVRP